ncbi:MAG: inositol monophosphatase [Clostridia bacterium]|nr:inositol monophosphatase [Clostridia bacterium]
MKVMCERLNFITEAIKAAYAKHGQLDENSLSDKSRFDLVTSTDYNIEEYLIGQIRLRYPDDKILSEETNNATVIDGKTWTIDPIDGTYNMANGIRIYGIQCAMYDGGKPVLCAIFLPHFDELYYAEAGKGAYLNGKPIGVKPRDLSHCTVSFGDFPHTRARDFELEHKIMKSLSSKIAKIRMFGAACMDFTCVASGKTSGTVVFTKNKWDITPGILLCREAGALIMDTVGEYSEDSAEVIAVSSRELYDCIRDSVGE